MRSDAPGRGTLIAVLPVTLAIFVFGTIYGASQAGTAPPGRVVAASALIFSGAAQFGAAGLLATGASAGAVLATVTILNARHLLLGAVLRQRLRGSTAGRGALAFLLIDETAGLALSASTHVRRTYVVAGALSYAAWVGGTALGVLGGAAPGAEDLAEAVFPVLFVGLAATAARGALDLTRAGAAFVATLGLALTLGELGGLLPVIVALAVAVPMPRFRRSRTDAR